MSSKISEIADLVQGKIDGDPAKLISSAAPLDLAGDDDITFAGSKKFLKKIEQSRAGCVIVPGNYQSSGRNLIQVDNPEVAFATVLNLFFKPKKPLAQTHPKACLGQNVVLGQNVSIGPFVSIGDNVQIGEQVILEPNVVIGDDVIIGNDVHIYPNVSILERCTIGSRVIIHAGTVIGSDGFGFAHDGQKYHKLFQTGIVRIDDDVEIGAGNTIDRASFGKTWLKRGVKTDNQVHLAHNVVIGEDTVIVAQVGISGSAVIGDHVIIAGQAGVAGHISIGNNVIIGPRAGITKSVPKGAVLSGAPEMPHKTWLKSSLIFPLLPDLKKKITKLEKQLAELKKN